MGDGELDALREQLLVVRAQGRDESAFQQLVALYNRRLLYYVHRILGSEQDRADVLQDIWIRVFLKMTTLRAPQAFRVWLYKIAHDVSISHLRSRRADELATDLKSDFAEACDTNDCDEFEMLDHAELVHHALRQLSLAHREALTLRFLEGLDLAELADITGCSVGTVKSRLHYAKLAMRRILEAHCRD